MNKILLNIMGNSKAAGTFVYDVLLGWTGSIYDVLGYRRRNRHYFICSDRTTLETQYGRNQIHA